MSKNFTSNKYGFQNYCPVWIYKGEHGSLSIFHTSAGFPSLTAPSVTGNVLKLGLQYSPRVQFSPTRVPFYDTPGSDSLVLHGAGRIRHARSNYNSTGTIFSLWIFEPEHGRSLNIAGLGLSSALFCLPVLLTFRLVRLGSGIKHRKAKWDRIRGKDWEIILVGWGLRVGLI